MDEFKELKEYKQRDNYNNKSDLNYEVLNTTVDTIENSPYDKKRNLISGNDVKDDETGINSKSFNIEAEALDVNLNREIIIENQELSDYDNSNIKKIKIEKSDDVELFSSRDNISKITIEKEELIFNNYNFILDFKKKEKFSFSKIGSMYCFWFDEDGIPKIAIGPHCKFNL